MEKPLLSSGCLLVMEEHGLESQIFGWLYEGQDVNACCL